MCISAQGEEQTVGRIAHPTAYARIDKHGRGKGTAARHLPPPGAISSVATTDSIDNNQGAFMKILQTVCIALLCGASAFSAERAAAATSKWHFKIKNSTDADIVKLQVSQNKKSWGKFDIGSGIGPGETATMYWDSSTDNEKCVQWIRAKFSDGTYSSPSKQDFCHDLDEPIVFSDDDDDSDD
jgi:hypothetical protein